MLQLAIAVFVVVLGSALCSGSETALLSVSILQARQLAQSRTPAALTLLAIREKINRPIATIVILNNVFNIVGSIVIGSIASGVLGDTLLGLFSGILTFLIIILGEIVPKTLGERYAQEIALVVALPVRWLTWGLSPVVWLVEHITAPLVKNYRSPTTNEAEIKLLAHIGYQEGLIEDDEADMIQRVFRLNDVTAADLMTPRVAVTHLPGHLTLQAVQAELIASQHTRILVTDQNIDQVRGVVLKDELLIALIQEQAASPVSYFSRPVQFVPEGERADRLLTRFQTTREHLAVVVDEYGGVAGVVTLEDVLEVLTGEIVDETDQSVDLQAWARQRRKRLLQTYGFSNGER